jgi:hypothetical protein
MCIMLMMSKRKPFIQPLTLANRVLHLDANTTFSGATHADPVSSWTDLSGNNYHQLAAGGARPQVQKTSNTSPNGKVLVRFDGVDDQMSSSGPVTWPGHTAGDTLYFYGRLKSSPGFALLWSDATLGRPQVGYEKALNGVPYVRTESGGTAVNDLHNATIFDTKMQLLVVRFGTGGTCQAYRALSGGDLTALSATPTYAFNGAESGLAIGASIVSANGYCLMDLATVIWCNEAHSVNTINGVRNALMATYGED